MSTTFNTNNSKSVNLTLDVTVENAQLRAQIAELKCDKRRNEGIIEEFKTDIIGCYGELKKRHITTGVRDNKIAELNGVIAELKLALDSTSRDQFDDTLIKQRDAEIKQRDAEITHLNGVADSLNRDIIGCTDELTDLRATIEKRDAEITHLNGVADSLNRDIIGCTDELTDLAQMLKIVMLRSPISTVLLTRSVLPLTPSSLQQSGSEQLQLD